MDMAQGAVWPVRGRVGRETAAFCFEFGKGGVFVPTKNFFSDPELEPENASRGRASSSGGQSTENDPFEGMQELNFDFDLNASNESEATSLDALFDEPARGAPAAPSKPSSTQAAPFVFDEPPSRPARPASARRGAAFDLSALEKEIDRPAQTPQPEELEGYAPLALDGFDLVREQPRSAASFVMDSSPAAPARKPDAAPQQAAPSRPQAAAPSPQAAPFVMDSAPAAPARKPDTAPQQTAESAARLRTPSPQTKTPGPGQNPAPRPASRTADYSTISFSLGDVSVEAPTMAFMPIEQINSAASAQAAADRRAAEKNTPPPPPSPESRAARMAKERDIGAAVFSALMEQDEPPAMSARPVSSGVPRASAETMEWPSPARSEKSSPRSPKPIDWRAPSTAARPQAESPAQPPQTTSVPVAQPSSPAQEDSLTPLDFDFNFDGTDAFDSAADPAPREKTRGLDLIDMYDRDPEERPARPRKTSRPDGERRAERGASGKGGPSGSGGAPMKTIFAWCGILLIAVLVILYFVLFGDKDGDASSAPGSSSGSIASSEPAQSAPVPAEPVAPPIPRDEWYMVLANRDSVLPMDFTVAETATVGEALVDARIADALRQMVNDAAAAGIRLKPTNGYRTVTRQDELWKARVQKLMTESGLSQADAEVRALDYTSRAGTSDHNTGLGLDIVSDDHPAKDAAYADTPAAAWLQEHAAEYGFILRYPSDKTAQTGMDFEPWHYRYVGVEQAQLIKASGLCLEEYLAQ